MSVTWGVLYSGALLLLDIYYVHRQIGKAFDDSSRFEHNVSLPGKTKVQFADVC